MAHPYAERRQRAQQRLQDRGSDAAIACPGPNLQYFTGFRGEPVDRFHILYIPANGATTLVTPEGYLTQAKSNATADAFETVDGNDPSAVAETIHSLLPDNLTEVLVDDGALQALTGPLCDAVGSEIIAGASPVFRPMRRRKDDAEIVDLRQSASVADAVSNEVRALGADAVGMTERELAIEIRSKLTARGATGTSFDVVVGSGPNGADPALRHGEREIQASEPVVLDFGCFLNGYASDQTRTVVFDGEPPNKFKRAHEAVLAALNAGVEVVEPGVTAGTVDAAARDTLGEYGLAEQFVHGTGHGVGLAAHEDLTIADSNEAELEPGMVFSVEPGVYFENKWGVRVEDLVVVTEEGCKRLNDSPRTWKAL